ncbi:hypothetical protein A3F07_01485 [candidate division WWE3 bacterium RIFCSPHIGHO2_12_FULL_38_15]|uniref:Uncharacterized protein n=1 Tax=candidate division WWE3 bacterium RIFCSPHIGHO2_02_FULL_38_14 TaxID=1802620 RepID=A0A1F4V8W9_UNCKA|nr:MAG: hypothetical protein A2793_01815 [candidate division WWE3 bacterium RIFCSPHIGHO2_01_FULL_38_45]OGC48377.1 MAG: hypothetical protein A3F07_01485 [candidate division WWE3 bacterium RIFCSPHIGHO2_12_FULL_38_15]OGC53646.1 MAG: hypothetical protein A3D91_04370 [candidate division WWE3 bacterium RIFCSPHIGHO2_02_FULL_38_14]OGC54311.1 MAG: hypothetical protein A3B64_02280 [candidate division WWE3 bacterium RIFCSPLOWO2_01_FULL_37_24]HLB51556.1 hypothetical protein [Patescibacteria group bacterium
MRDESTQAVYESLPLIIRDHEKEIRDIYESIGWDVPNEELKDLDKIEANEQYFMIIADSAAELVDKLNEINFEVDDRFGDDVKSAFRFLVEKKSVLVDYLQAAQLGTGNDSTLRYEDDARKYLSCLLLIEELLTEDDLLQMYELFGNGEKEIAHEDAGLGDEVMGDLENDVYLITVIIRADLYITQRKLRLLRQ